MLGSPNDQMVSYFVALHTSIYRGIATLSIAFSVVLLLTLEWLRGRSEKLSTVQPWIQQASHKG